MIISHFTCIFIKNKLKLMIISHFSMYTRVYFIKKKLKLMIISHSSMYARVYFIKNKLKLMITLNITQDYAI
jgi:hypothetical protein